MYNVDQLRDELTYFRKVCIVLFEHVAHSSFKPHLNEIYMFIVYVLSIEYSLIIMLWIEILIRPNPPSTQIIQRIASANKNISTLVP